MHIPILAQANPEQGAAQAVDGAERLSEALFADTIFQEVSYLGNELWRYALFAALLLAAIFAGKLIGWLITVLARRVSKEKRPMTAALFEALGRSLALLLFAFVFDSAFNVFNLSPSAQAIFATAGDVVIVIAITLFVLRLVSVPVNWIQERSKAETSKMDSMLVNLVSSILKAVVILLGLFQVVAVISGQPPEAIIAGLGIGGLAVALAAQDSLSHFLGSIAIIGDKPFRVGERIIVDGYDGPVEKVGLRSTQIRTLAGNQVTIPNGELAKKTIENPGRRPHIRRIINLGVTYDTPPEKLRRACDIVREILENHEGMHPDFPPRVMFNDFNAASLNIFVIYWYHPPEWWDYMAHAQKVNFEILERFNAEGIDFAFPTQTLHLAGDPKRPLSIGLDSSARNSSSSEQPG